MGGFSLVPLLLWSGQMHDSIAVKGVDFSVSFPHISARRFPMTRHKKSRGKKSRGKKSRG
jgi:hypothetical protein